MTVHLSANMFKTPVSIETAETELDAYDIECEGNYMEPDDLSLLRQHGFIIEEIYSHDYILHVVVVEEHD